MLNRYLQLTQQMLGDYKQEMFNPVFLTQWINVARGQLAGEAFCIRTLATIPTVVGQQFYNFSSINVGTPATTGIQAVIHVRRVYYSVGTGQKRLAGRSWEWFDLYHMNNPVPPSGAPTVWAQYGQGATGSFAVSPLPDLIYTLTCDCVCYPISLAKDTDVEALPFLWTDAIPFYAVYYALLQVPGRMDDAQRYYQYYTQFVARARAAATPDVVKYNFEQVPDPTGLNQIGMSQGRSAGGQQ